MGLESSSLKIGTLRRALWSWPGCIGCPENRQGGEGGRQSRGRRGLSGGGACSPKSRYLPSVLTLEVHRQEACFAVKDAFGLEWKLFGTHQQTLCQKGLRVESDRVFGTRKSASYVAISSRGPWAIL